MKVSAVINTKIGDALVVADDKFLYSLEFIDNVTANENKVTEPILSIKYELEQYFAGTLKEFKTPIKMQGTSFQMLSWDALLAVPYGETISYSEQASKIGNPKHIRAVANANAANKLMVIVPCHRIIRSSGEISGYRGGKDKKHWLLEHEKGFK